MPVNAKSLYRWVFVGGAFLLFIGFIGIGSSCGTVMTPVPVSTVTGIAATPARGSTPTPTVAPLSFLTPIPPTPTFTPSPSPTPVIHYVVAGNTLLGIALEYGVTVEALVQANNLNINDYLRIGQALIIPLGREETVATTVAEPVGRLILPTPTPQPLEITGVSLRRTAVGGLLCLGEVRNTINSPVTNVQVQVTLVDAGGNPLVQQTALAAVDYLAPEQRAPFAVTFREPPLAAVDVRIALLRAETIGPVTAGFVPLTVTAVEAGMSGPQYRVTGTLVNDSGGAVTLPTVVVTLYDANGLVLSYREAVLETGGHMAAGARLPFSVLLTFQGVPEPADFQIVAWGMRTG